ncbi:MAG: PEP-CTERM system histidine kinase PrsK [Nitrococcus sp.]|nr:PEP-CTERM system histidine kinase PrsK [Nitrococcus sp.]
MAVSVAAVSYGVATVAYMLLLALLFAGLRGFSRGVTLLLATFLCACWGATYTISSQWSFAALRWLIPMFEFLRWTGWFCFVAMLLRLSSPQAMRQSLRADPWVLLTGFAVLLAGCSLAALSGYSSGLPAFLGIAGMLLVSLFGMALIEQLYRRVEPGQRWGIKHLCLGLGVAFAFDFYCYADGLLFAGLNAHILAARGFVNALAVPLIAVSAARNPKWSLHIGVSRRMVVDSVVITGAGVYLLLMAIAGYSIRYAGGNWGHALQIVFLAGALLVFLAALFSGSLRAWIRIFISKHFFSYKYDYRQEWLRFIRTLSTNGHGEPLRVRAIRAIAQLVDSPSGALWSANEQGNLILAATWNISFPGTLTEPADTSLVRCLRRHEWIVELNDYRRHPERYGELLLPDWLGRVRDPWLIVPLLQQDSLQGFAVLSRPKVAREINWEDRDLLKTAGRQVASYVAHLDATDALIDARQFDAFNRLSAFVVHDLKNVSAQLSLITANAAKYRANPEFVADAFQTMESATQRMDRVLANLRKLDAPLATVEQVDIGELVGEVASSLAQGRPAPRVRITTPGLIVNCPRGRLVTVLEHLVCNAQDATPPDGDIELSVAREAGWCRLEVRDTGAGMAEEFIRERLFRPFATTKGNAGMGIGVFEARHFVEGIGGLMDVISAPNEGSCFVLRLPLHESAPVVPMGDANREVLRG